MRDTSTFETRYQMLRTIGSGGMGVVYLVVDSRRGNQIMALKALKALQDEEAAERFRSEFRSIRGFVHPHIPEVYDFGALPEAQGGYYFTCEFVDGKPLDQLIKQWKPDQLRYVLVSMCRALAFLHSRKLLHRDIKPDNVLGRLSPDGEFAALKLVDFGMAGNGAQEEGTPGGTIDYMAPELLAHSNATAQTDLYALGMLLYRLATGHLPFEGDDAIANSQQRSRSEAPHPLRFRPDLPIGLADVIAALVQINPKNRPESARHTIAMLNERDGVNFEFETSETRRSYISSSSMVTNVAAREQLATFREQLKYNVAPPNVLISARPGLGRTRLLKDFSVELTLAGFSTRFAGSPRELPNESQYPNVLLIPDAHLLDRARFESIVQKAETTGTWLITAGDFTEAIPVVGGNWRALTLAPLDQDGVQSFVDATFPDSDFNHDFNAQLFGHTLGVPSALEAALDELVSANQLRIGLTGWEFIAGRIKLPVHRHVKDIIVSDFRSLDEPTQKLLCDFACTLTPLPWQFADGLGDNDGKDKTELLKALLELGWLKETGNSLEIRNTVQLNVLLTLISETDIRSGHKRLHNLWQDLQTDDQVTRNEELLFHDFLSGAFSLSGESLEPIVKAALRRGKVTWARKPLEYGLAYAPQRLREYCLIELARLEYTEGNMVRAADLLGEATQQGALPISPENLPHFARYASLREKTGHTEHAEQILQRCLPLLDRVSPQIACSVLGTMAWIEFKRGNGDKARELAESGLMKMPAESTEADSALLLNTIATLAFYRGDTDVARLYWQRGLEVFEVLGDRKGIANMYNNLGVLASQAGDRLRARSLWQRCADLSRQINDTHRLAGIYNNLGIDALESGELSAAEDYYHKSLALFRELQSPREQAEILSNLGELAYQRADYTRSMAYLNEAVTQAIAQGDQELQLEPQIYLGKLLLTLDEVEDSERVLGNVREIAGAIGTRKAEGQAWEALASLYARRGEEERACAAADRARDLLADEADPLALLHLHLTRCQIAAETGHLEDVAQELAQARKVADTKWDPYTAARTKLTESLYEEQEIDPVKWQVALRKISIYPDLLWRFHWATGRSLARTGQFKRALDEFGRGVAILKAITYRLPEDRQKTFLNAPHILRFKQEALELRNHLQAPR